MTYSQNPNPKQESFPNIPHTLHTCMYVVADTPLKGLLHDGNSRRALVIDIAQDLTAPALPGEDLLHTGLQSRKQQVVLLQLREESREGEMWLTHTLKHRSPLIIVLHLSLSHYLLFQGYEGLAIVVKYLVHATGQCLHVYPTAWERNCVKSSRRRDNSSSNMLLLRLEEAGQEEEKRQLHPDWI